MFVVGYQLPVGVVQCFGEAVVLYSRLYRFIVGFVSVAVVVVAHCSGFGVLFIVRWFCVLVVF
jgi:hypothetical protein